MRRESFKRTRGFTLIEMLVVIVIMGILAGITLPAVMGRTDDARVAATKVQISMLSLALDMYKADNGFYPNTEQGLKSLVQKPSSSPAPENWKGSYLKDNTLPADQWGNRFVYLCPGRDNRAYDIVSYGSDNARGGDRTAADIESWNIKKSE
jgi:general secretion pathway protein G